MRSRIRERLIALVVLVSVHFTISDARISKRMPKMINPVSHSQNTEPYGTRNPGFSLAPFGSISPLPLPAHTIPAFCADPPPSPAAPGPATHIPPALLPPSSPSRPKFPPTPTLPYFGPSSPKQGVSPPVVFPPPSASHPPPSQQPHKPPVYEVWCVAKPTVPDPMMQAAMDYACGSGADCKPIQPNGPCFQPDTLLAHASYAFNSYFQNKKIRGGTCDFGGTAMLVTVDPSFNGCRFIFN